MTSKIIVNNIEADAGVSTVTFGSDISANVTGNITGNITGNVTGDVTVATGATISGSTNTITASTNGSERLRINSSGDIEVGSYTNSGNTVLFKTDDNNTTRINFYDENNTEGCYLKAEGILNGGIFRMGNRWNTDSDKISFNMVDGTIGVPNGGGLSFAATSDASGSTSELFDDYEEGTWTPTTNGATLTVNHARYRRIGSLVYVTCSLDVTVGGSNEAAHIYGLPFSVDSSTGNNYVASESRRINEDPTILYSIGYAASSIANKYVGRNFSSNQISAIYSNSTSTGQPIGSASWQINISGVRTVIYGWYIAA